MNELESYITEYFGLSEGEGLRAVSNLFKKQELKKGEFLLQMGVPANKMSFIRSGILRVFAIEDGHEVTQWISTPGNFVTDLSSFIFEGGSRWNIQALTDSTLFTISKTDYTEIVKKVPRWHELEKLFIVKCFTFLENRVYTHLSRTAEERYILFFEQHPSLFNQVPLQYIASMLGMTPETFSRIRKKLQS
jgi:CRP/FNR family transcriptional regulator, anaerobic regulatory protein